MSDDVVRAFPGVELPPNPLAIDDPDRFTYCSHESVRVNTHDRVITCSKCGKTLDAFNFVHANAKTIQTAWEYHKQAMAKVAELNKTVHDLKKEEKRLRATVKRLRDQHCEAINVRSVDQR